MFDAEALLLVDHEQAEALEADVALEQSVGADHDVDCARLETVHCDLLLGRRAQAGEQADLHLHRGEALAEGLEVLLREHGCGNQHGDLMPGHHRFEGGADRDLGLAVADVADDQAIHRLGRFLVAADLLDRAVLIERLDVGERRLELDLPGCVGFDCDAGLGLAGGMEFQQFVGDFGDGTAHSRLGSLPLAAAESRQRRRRVGRADVGLDAIELVGGDEQAVAFGEADVEVLALAAADLLSDDALEPSDAAVDMDDEVTGLQGLQQMWVGFRGRAGLERSALALALEAEDFGVADQRDQAFAAGGIVELPALGDGGPADRDGVEVGRRFGFQPGEREAEVGHELGEAGFL